jgi:tRNA pseudouridine32 synthase/23S rRNA pseudouridine746 synthase
LLARNPRAVKHFQQAFEQAGVTKTYLAVLDGVIEGDEGTIELPVAKISSAKGGWRMVVDPGGKAAATRWRRIA